MSIVNIAFDGGDNNRVQLQWELLDTPPAQAWKRMNEHTLENPSDNPLHITEAAFCETKQEAIGHWEEVMSDLAYLKLPIARVVLGKLKPTHVDRLLADLRKIVAEGDVNDIAGSQRIADAIDRLKHVSFYLHHVRESDFDGGRVGSAFGNVHHIPDPHFAIQFEPEWISYLTMDIIPGTLYAELNYDGDSWYSILALANDTMAEQAITAKHYGPPTTIGSGFTLPLSHDIAGKEIDLLNYFYNNRARIARLDPTFDPIAAYRSCGRLPIAKLVELPHASRGTGYANLSKIKGVSKIEFLESY